MTTKREQAMRNAVASARMEGLPVSKQTERDCVRYLEGRIDTATPCAGNPEPAAWAGPASPEVNHFCGLSRERFAEELLDLYERTNELHPFREGNGRTQRVFLAQLAQNAGYRLDFSCVDADELMIATIYAAQGIDLPLKEMLDKIIKE